MKSILNLKILPLLITSYFCCYFMAITQAAENLPNSLTAAILVKLISFEKNISQKSSINIYVLGDELLAQEVNKYTGKAIGKAVLNDVRFGVNLPNTPPDILFIGHYENVKSVVEFTKKHQLMSASYNPMIANIGISLIIFDDEGMPGIILNTSASHAEGLSWKPEVLEIAKTLQENQ